MNFPYSNHPKLTSKNGALFNCYPPTFGMQIQNRSYTNGGGGYRFGFNGMERDDEIKGEGNSLDFGARIYDSRLGRWMSTDKFQLKDPSLTPYHFAANNPIIFVDEGGNYIRISYMTHSQWLAFKHIVENRPGFTGDVELTYTTLSKTIHQYNEHTKKIEDVVVVAHQLKLTINEETIKSRIVKENPDFTPDQVQQKVEERKSEIESIYAYQYLNTLINTEDNGNSFFQLTGGDPIAMYEGSSINAKSIAKSGIYAFNILLHEVSEQNYKANKLQLPGLPEGKGGTKGYPSAHWQALITQAKDMGGDFVITKPTFDYINNKHTMTFTLYTAIVKDGEITAYSKKEQ